MEGASPLHFGFGCNRVAYQGYMSHLLYTIKNIGSNFTSIQCLFLPSYSFPLNDTKPPSETALLFAIKSRPSCLLLMHLNPPIVLNLLRNRRCSSCGAPNPPSPGSCSPARLTYPRLKATDRLVATRGWAWKVEGGGGDGCMDAPPGAYPGAKR